MFNFLLEFSVGKWNDGCKMVDCATGRATIEIVHFQLYQYGTMAGRFRRETDRERAGTVRLFGKIRKGQCHL